MTQYEVNKLKRDRAAFQVAQDGDLKDMMERYVYLDGSSSIWDNQLWRMIDQGSAKLAMGSQFKIWQDSPARIVKRFDRVVFEPGRKNVGRIHQYLSRAAAGGQGAVSAPA